ncbi:MAG: zinc ribbon domain-containing protein [Candidatus Helarchaeota archaeon]|nr:zinc ribbon domain-containing protein [Candidatus Helarchaeota archaeon]
MDAIANEIIEYMNKILSQTTYLGIFGENDKVYYMQGALKKYLPFLQSYIQENFKLLGVGDHSIPLSGVNLVFFKITENSILVLHTREGPVGQLLAFKSRMFRFADKIEDEIIKLTPVKKKTEPRKKTAVSAERIPVLTVSIDKKKFPMDEASILHNIDGEKTITEICQKTKIPRLKVNEILKKYQKKGWVRLKRVIGGKTPKPTEKPQIIITKEVKKVTKPKPPAPKIIKTPTPSQPKRPAPFVAKTPESKKVAQPITKPTIPTKPIIEKKVIPEFQPKGAEPEVLDDEIIYNFPILTVEEPKVKMSKNEQKILKMCDGRNTVEDICNIFSMNKVELMSTLRKFQKKGILKLTRIIPSSTKEAKAKILEKKSVSIDEYDKHLVGQLDDLIDKVEKKIEMRIEDEDPEKLVEKAVQKQAVPEEPIVAEEEFEETLTDLEKLLETTEESSESSEIQSFDDALTELTDLLDDSSTKEKTTESISLEQPISEPEKKASSTPLTPTESEVSTTNETQTEIVPKIKGAKVICQHCKAALPSTKRICSQCGNPVRTCPHCSAPISVHTRICPDCSGIVT